MSSNRSRKGAESSALSESDSDLKRKSRKKHSGHDRDSDDEEYQERKKHKKSKKSGKEKHKDKDRSKEKKEKYGPQLESEVIEKELSAIEKFNMFKKQREAAKQEGSVVDDLFKDFIASKIKQIENESNSAKEKKGQSKILEESMSDSVNEINKFLDEEINSLEKPDTKKLIKSAKTLSDTTTLGSLLKIDKVKGSKSQNVSKSKDTDPNVSKESDKPEMKLSYSGASESAKLGELHVKEPSQTDLVLETIPLPPVSSVDIKVTVSSTQPGSDPQPSLGSELSKQPLPVFGPILPKLEKKEGVEEVPAQMKKPVMGFKHFGIKLSATSAELIQSGEIHKKGKRLEDGKY